MVIADLDYKIVSVPYTHREDSAQVNRDGVTEVLVKITTDQGLVGWGESCSGANAESVFETLKACTPFLRGRDPWEREALWRQCLHQGIWNFRESTFNFAWAGIDMALWDLCGKACGQPVYNLLGGLQRREVDYFYYLSYGDLGRLEAECREGVERGYEVFYVKVGVDFDFEKEAVALIRGCIGPRRKLRIDANQAWSVAQAQRYLGELEAWGIDFAEQPVPAHPVENMLELKAKVRVPLAANEGLWRVADAWEVIKRRSCDVLCFSPYWVGSVGLFYRLSWAAAVEGLSVCKHTHGELGLAAAACHQVLLALPRIVEGHQQTAQIMQGDVLAHALPIASGPRWGVPQEPGLGVEVDEARVAQYHRHYLERGQYLPYDPNRLRP